MTSSFDTLLITETGNEIEITVLYIMEFPNPPILKSVKREVDDVEILRTLTEDQQDELQQEAYDDYLEMNTLDEEDSWDDEEEETTAQ